MAAYVRGVWLSRISRLRYGLGGCQWHYCRSGTIAYPRCKACKDAANWSCEALGCRQDLLGGQHTVEAGLLRAVFGFALRLSMLLAVLSYYVVLGSAQGACINTVAGLPPTTGVGAAPTSFSLPTAAALVVDGSSPPALFLSAAHAVWAAQADGSSVIFAGAPTPGFAGDGASAANARFSSPLGLEAIPAANALLVADSGNSRVRMIMLGNASIKTLVGARAAAAASGDGGTPAAATLVRPIDVALSPTSGDVYIADAGANCVRRASYGGAAAIGAAAGVITTAIGACDAVAAAPAPAAGAAAPALSALSAVRALSFDAEGALYIVDAVTVWRAAGLDTAAPPSRVALYDFSTPFAASASLLGVFKPMGITVREDPDGSATPPGRLVLVASDWGGTNYYNSLVVALTPAGAASVFSGLPNTRTQTGEGGPALAATTYDIAYLTADATRRSVYFIATSASAVRRVSPRGVITTVLQGVSPGTGGGSGQMANAVSLSGPRGIAVSPAGGKVYFVESATALVRVVESNGTLLTVAGSGVIGNGGDGGPALAAAMNFPYSVALTRSSDLIISVLTSACVRLVRMGTGAISTVAGVCGVKAPNGGDGGPATAATFGDCKFLALDAADNMFISDATARVMRLVNSSTGLIRRFAGTGQILPESQYVYNYSAENSAQAADFAFRSLGGAAVSNGIVYVADGGYNTVFAIRVMQGTFYRVLGVPWNAYYAPAFASLPPMPPAPYPSATNPFNMAAGALGTYWGVNTPFSPPQQVTLTLVAMDTNGDLLVTASADGVIVRVAPATGNVSLLAGNGMADSGGDLGDPLAAALNLPTGIAVDATSGDVYVTLRGDNLVRVISRSSTYSACPAGYQCPCGLSPRRCDNPALYCPAASAAASLTAPGYVSAAALDAAGNTIYVSQSICPLGSWCLGGIKTPCAPGTFGTLTRQSSPTACASCAAGRYLPVKGAGAAAVAGALVDAESPCSPCAPGFFAPSPAASSFCVACPPGTSAAPALGPAAPGKLGNSSSSSSSSSGAAPGTTSVAPSALYCFPCPAGAASGYGAAACAALSGGSSDTSRALPPTYAFVRSLPFSDGNIDPAALTALYTATAAPLVGLFSVPLAALGLVYGIIWALGSWEAFWAPLSLLLSQRRPAPGAATAQPWCPHCPSPPSCPSCPHAWSAQSGCGRSFRLPSMAARRQRLQKRPRSLPSPAQPPCAQTLTLPMTPCMPCPLRMPAGGRCWGSSRRCGGR